MWNPSNLRFAGMKRYTRSEKYKAHMRRRARRTAAARARFKAYQRRVRQLEQGMSAFRRERLRHYKYPNNYKRHGRRVRYRYIWAPPLFSFRRNPEAVSQFIQRLKDCFEQNQPVYVVLLDVKEIDYDAITVLLSVMVEFKAKGIKFNGDFPENRAAKADLIDSRFFTHLERTFERDLDSYELAGKSSIMTHGRRKVEAELGQEVIKSASRTVWGESRRCMGVQRTLVELMLNTNNHAGSGKLWWLSVKHFEKERYVAFSFVDYGVGVFVSLDNKPKDSVFYRVFQRIDRKLGGVLGNFWSPHGNADMLRMIFHGEVHRTATGKYWRGKGLPGVYQSLVDNKLSNFAMITNNVFYDSRNEEYRSLECGFSGTFVYWELAVGNESFPYED